MPRQRGGAGSDRHRKTNRLAMVDTAAHCRRRIHRDPRAAVGEAVAAGLMDEETPPTDLLHKILDSHVGPDAKEPDLQLSKLRHREQRTNSMVDFHIMVPADGSIAQGIGSKFDRT